MPVTVGFTSAAAITIATSQLKSLFGLKGRTDKFVESVENFLLHIHEAHLWDAVLGISTIVALLLMQVSQNQHAFKSMSMKVFFMRIIFQKLSVFRVKGNTQDPPVSMSRKVIGNTLWMISLARNAVVVFFGIALAYIFYVNGHNPFSLTGKYIQSTSQSHFF